MTARSPRVRTDHIHLTDQLRDDDGSSFDGGGSTPTLAEVLVEGRIIPGDPDDKQIEATGTAWGGGGWLELREPNTFSGKSGDAGIIAGEADSGHGGGDAILYGGERVGGSLAGYVLALGAGADESGGGVYVATGSAGAASGKDGGDITLTPGAGDGAGRDGKIVLSGLVELSQVNGADGAASSPAADVYLYAGYGDAGSVAGGGITLYGGTAGAGGGTDIVGGAAGVGSDDDGGDIRLIPGANDGAGRNGLVFLNLPTSDPAVSGALWNNAGTVKVSA